MKIAFVHDWFNVDGGAEKVADEILDIYKNEDITIYTLFNSLSKEDSKKILKNYPIRTTLLNYIPYRSVIYRYLLPLMPFFIRQFYLKDYDLIISSSHAVAKGFRKAPGILHVCYCHTPMRYAWDMYEEYAQTHTFGQSFLYKTFVKYIRKWDLRSSDNVDYYIANSINVQQRILNNYKRESVVIYPPVRIEMFNLSEQPRKDYYLCIGRFVPYKKMDLVLQAFQHMPDKKLILIGEGYGSSSIQDLLKHAPNIEWLGYVNDKDMIHYIQEATACIFAAKEDFGILCVEIQACGTPVIALRNGGYLETVVEGATGYLFDDQTEESIVSAIKKLDAKPLTDHKLIRQNALKFSDERFRNELTTYIEKVLKEFHSDKKIS